MPILVPAHPLFGEGARAERAVWEVLRDQLPDEAVLFHSLRVQERQNEYEADISCSLECRDGLVMFGKVRSGGL